METYYMDTDYIIEVDHATAIISDNFSLKKKKEN